MCAFHVKEKPISPRPKKRPGAMRKTKVYKYDQRRRTLEEVSKLLGVALDIKLLGREVYTWQVKLERLSLQYSNPSKRRYLVCRADNPNFAMAKLCAKISHKTVIAPQPNGEDKIVTLGEVVKGSLYVRLMENDWATSRPKKEGINYEK